MNQQKTILITGGTGYLGSHTALLMAQHGYRVLILDTLIHNQPTTYPWATVINADFADTEILNRIFTEHTIAAVFHCADLHTVQESMQEPFKLYTATITKTLTLLETMLAHNITNFIFSSSCAVYGNPTYLPMNEQHPRLPLNPYGKSKLAIEIILEDLQVAYGLNFVALRIFNAAGALPEYGLGEQCAAETHLIPLLLEAAKTTKPFTIFGTDHPTPDGTCVRDYVHVLDIAHAHKKAWEHLQAGMPSDFFNIGTGHGISVREMITAVEQLCTTKIKIILSKQRPGDPAYLVADSSHARTVLNWQPYYSDLSFILKTAHAFQYKTHQARNNVAHLFCEQDKIYSEK